MSNIDCYWSLHRNSQTAPAGWYVSPTMHQLVYFPTCDVYVSTITIYLCMSNTVYIQSALLSSKKIRNFLVELPVVKLSDGW